MNERTREKMILIGKGNDLPVLGYVASDSPMAKGDRIITSGDGGIFPKAIAVGRIRSTGGTGAAVELFANVAQLEYVTMVQFKP